MIVILHEIASPREELLLNLNFIQQNYSFYLFPMVGGLVSVNNKDKLLQSAICKSLFESRLHKTFQVLLINTYDILVSEQHRLFKYDK